MTWKHCFVLCLFLPALDLLPTDSTCQAQNLQLRPNDRLVVLGNTLVERDAEFGYWETYLTTCVPERNLVFRNLGWSGDTVTAQARAGFDSAAEGFQRMADQVQSLKPTLILVAYGANESFAGKAGLADFQANLKRLLDTLSSTGARVVLVTPPRFESPPSPLPDAAAHNVDVDMYASAICQIARERSLPFIDLNEELSAGDAPLTYNGIHLNDWGYWNYGIALAAAFDARPSRWSIELSEQGELIDSQGTQVSELDRKNESIHFTCLDATLPPPVSPTKCSGACDAWPGSQRHLKVTGLPEGRYTLLIDDQTVTSGTAADWSEGVTLTSGPEFDQTRRVRNVVRQKNEYYFYRWRPQNDTYLLGFRKHEQGQNAIEIPQFDPLVAQQEAIIAALERPVPHRYQLTHSVRPIVQAESTR